jgi:hypothetical protein
MGEDYWYLLEDHSAVLDHRDILRGLDEPLLAPQGGDHLLPCNTLKEYQFFCCRRIWVHPRPSPYSCACWRACTCYTGSIERPQSTELTRGPPELVQHSLL